MYARYSALEKKAAEMRIGSDRTVNTRVAFMEEDFKLLWRVKNQKTGWNEKQHPEGLPEFQLHMVGGTQQSPTRSPPKGRERYREQVEVQEDRVVEREERTEDDSESSKRPHSPADQGAAKKRREEEEQARSTGNYPPLVQVDYHAPGSPGLGLQNRRLFEHVTVRKESGKNQQ